MTLFRRPLAVLALGALSMVLVGGCASSGRPAILGQAVTLQPGQRLALPDHASLRYVTVTADSRCPPGVQCIQAGDADVAFEFVPGAGAARSITLNTVKAPAAPIGEWQLHLLSLQFGSSPRATIQVDGAAR